MVTFEVVSRSARTDDGRPVTVIKTTPIEYTSRGTVRKRTHYTTDDGIPLHPLGQRRYRLIDDDESFTVVED